MGGTKQMTVSTVRSPNEHAGHCPYQTQYHMALASMKPLHHNRRYVRIAIRFLRFRVGGWQPLAS